MNSRVCCLPEGASCAGEVAGSCCFGSVCQPSESSGSSCRKMRMDLLSVDIRDESLASSIPLMLTAILSALAGNPLPGQNGTIGDMILFLLQTLAMVAMNAAAETAFAPLVIIVIKIIAQLLSPSPTTLSQ